MLKKDMIKSINFSALKSRVMTTKGIAIGVGGFILLSLVLMIISAATPTKGNILYGMCSKFLELQLPFPETIEQKEIELYRKGVRINYTHLDGFGEYRLEMIECGFSQHPERGVEMKDAFFNYVKPATEKERIEGKGRFYRVKQENIDLFNRSRSPAAILEDIDLSIPDGAIVRAY